jgi:hypothetical protein
MEKETEILLEPLKIEPDGVHLLLEAFLNGVACRLVLDTGASKTVLDLAYIEKTSPALSIKKEDDESAGVGGINLSSFSFIAEELSLGSLKEKHIVLAAMDLSHVIASYKAIGAPAIQGVLGGDLLRKYKAKIDYEQNKLSLQFPTLEE